MENLQADPGQFFWIPLSGLRLAITKAKVEPEEDPECQPTSMLEPLATDPVHVRAARNSLYLRLLEPDKDPDCLTHVQRSWLPKQPQVVGDKVNCHHTFGPH